MPEHPLVWLGFSDPEDNPPVTEETWQKYVDFAGDLAAGSMVISLTGFVAEIFVEKPDWIAIRLDGVGKVGLFVMSTCMLARRVLEVKPHIMKLTFPGWQPPVGIDNRGEIE